MAKLKQISRKIYLERMGVLAALSTNILGICQKYFMLHSFYQVLNNCQYINFVNYLSRKFIKIH